MDQLWTCHLIGNVWRAVLLWGRIFILIAVFLEKIAEKDQATTETRKDYPEILSQTEIAILLTLADFKAIKSINKKFN